MTKYRDSKTGEVYEVDNPFVRKRMKLNPLSNSDDSLEEFKGYGSNITVELMNEIIEKLANTKTKAPFIIHTAIGTLNLSDPTDIDRYGYLTSKSRRFGEGFYTPEEEKYYKDFMTLKGRQLSRSTSYGNLVVKIMTDREFALRHKFDVIRNWKEEKNENSK